MEFSYDNDTLFNALYQEVPEKARLQRMNQGIWEFFCENIDRYGFQSREGQENMALDIGEAIANKRHLMVEAGVGIGKSFAYIVPLMLFKKQFRRPVIISTSTITLQEQLRGDIKTISELLNFPVQTIIAKGQSHFICRRKVEEHKDRSLRSQVCKAMDNKAVERSDLVSLEITDAQWQEIAISGYGKRYCKDCPHHSKCFFSIMRNKLKKQNCDFIVCNHDLLVANLKKIESYSTPILADAPLIIVDEAHNLESTARNQLTMRCSLSDYDWAISTVRNGVSRFEDLERQADRIRSTMEKLFRELHQQVQKQRIENAADRENNRYFYTPTATTEECIQRLSHSLYKLQNSVQIRLRDNANQTFENAADRLSSISSMFTQASLPDESVFWIESDSKDVRHLQFTLCPNDISGWLHDTLLANQGVTILTSATLTSQSTGSLRDMYRYVADNVGFSRFQGDFAEPKPSPFDYEHHAMMYCADDLPHPTKDKELFISKACDRIIELIKISHGSALILFTAKADLNAVYEELSKRNLPYPIMRPYAGASQADTLESFRMQKNAVLLGTGAFWEGINLAGDVLTNVIIFKLPFPVPDPIIDAKTKAATNGLMDVLVPEMVVKLKQGIGRLIRSENDKGIISILDPRLSEAYHTPYRETVFEALPIKNKTSTINEIQKFYTTVVEQE